MDARGGTTWSELRQETIVRYIQQRQLDEDAADFMPLDKIRISLEDFKERAKELQVYGSGVEDFFRCNDFKRSFKVLRSEKVIEKLFWILL